MAFNFGTSTTKPTLNLGSSLNVPTTTNFTQSNQQPPASTSNTQIDIEHVKPTTKFDQLKPELQQEIETLDTAILNEMKKCADLADLLPAVISAGNNIPSAIDYCSQKLDEVEIGLENDAEATVRIRDNDAKKAEGEAKCVFRAVDRLKVPRQYQVGHSQEDTVTGGVYSSSGLSGWWNNPQTLRGTLRSGAGAGNTMQLPGEDADDGLKGPKNLLDLFSGKSDEMNRMMSENSQLLSEVESFVGGLEDKVRARERDLIERMNHTGNDQDNIQSEKDHQMQLLRYVFGEVQKGLYNSADGIASCRDGVGEIGLGR